MLSNIIRFFRKLSGMSQEQLASRLHVDRTLISKYESGLVEPSFGTLTNIADLLQVDIVVFCLCLELSKYSLNEGKKLLFETDQIEIAHYLESSWNSSTCGLINPYNTISGLSPSERLLVLQYLEDLHGQQVTSYY